MAPKALEVLTLPTSVVSRVDALRLSREVENISSQLDQAGLTAASEAKLPHVSPVLEDMAHDNRLNLLHAEDRNRLHAFLLELKEDAPTIHMSFATLPPATFTAKLVEWLRSEIHPMLLLDVGLQPSIAAGCVIRTTNKYFDCSMRQHLLTNRPKLIEILNRSRAA